MEVDENPQEELVQLWYRVHTQHLRWFSMTFQVLSWCFPWLYSTLYGM